MGTLAIIVQMATDDEAIIFRRRREDAKDDVSSNGAVEALFAGPAVGCGGL